MPLHNTKLDDHDLIRYCHEHSELLGILSEITKDRLNALWNLVKPADPDSRAGILIDHHRDVRDLWYNLLIDAVHALKVRDAREKAEIRGFDDSNATKRTKARKKSAYGINELLEYFDAFESFEGNLYGSEPVYRDHVVHVLRVWLIGVRILLEEGVHNLNVGMRALGSHKQSKAGDVPAVAIKDDPTQAEKANLKKCDIGVWNEELWGIWTLAALCHDLGYPLEKTYKVNAAVDTMLRHFGQISMRSAVYSFKEQHHALTRETLKLVASKTCLADEGRCTYKTQIQEKFHTKFARSLAS